jgi:hypothetical protein
VITLDEVPTIVRKDVFLVRRAGLPLLVQPGRQGITAEAAFEHQPRETRVHQRGSRACRELGRIGATHGFGRHHGDEAQSVSVGGYASAAGPWCSDAAGVWRGSDQAIDAAACGDELGKTAEASVRCKDPVLRALRWPADMRWKRRYSSIAFPD